MNRGDAHCMDQTGGAAAPWSFTKLGHTCLHSAVVEPVRVGTCRVLDSLNGVMEFRDPDNGFPSAAGAY